VTIEVTDTGPGLPAGALDARAGGLQVARDIARMHGGDLEAQSAGAGTHLVLSVPGLPGHSA
jgi:signal transduction histidine kinase